MITQGIVIAFLGSAIAIGLACSGSGIGVGIAIWIGFILAGFSRNSRDLWFTGRVLGINENGDSRRITHSNHTGSGNANIFCLHTGRRGRLFFRMVSRKNCCCGHRFSRKESRRDWKSNSNGYYGRNLCSIFFISFFVTFQRNKYIKGRILYDY